jgi:hypothetical protein
MSNIQYAELKLEVFMAMKPKFMVFWVVALCSAVVGYKHFEEPCCLHFSVDGGSKVL